MNQCGAVLSSRKLHRSEFSHQFSVISSLFTQIMPVLSDYISILNI